MTAKRLQDIAPFVKRKDLRDFQKELQELTEKYAPKVIEEYEENGIIVKRYEAR